MHQCARAAGSALASTAKRKSAAAYGRKATADKAEGIRGPGGPSALAVAATRPACRRLSAAGRRVSAAPHVAASRVAARRADLLRPRGAQLPCSASPPSSRPTLSLPPLGSRWTRPPPAAAGITARASELRGLRSRVPATGLELAFSHQGTSRFSVTRSPRRKGRDEARLFLCRLPGSTCAACGFLGTRGPRPGLALPAACLELDWSGLERQARVSLREREAGAPWAVGRARPGGVRIRDAGRRAGSESSRTLVRSCGLLPTHPLSPFVSLPWPCPRRGPACESLSPRRPPLALQKGSLPGQAGDDPPGLGSSGRRSRETRCPAPWPPLGHGGLLFLLQNFPLLLDTGS